MRQHDRTPLTILIVPLVQMLGETVAAIARLHPTDGQSVLYCCVRVTEVINKFRGRICSQRNHLIFSMVPQRCGGQ